VCLCYSYADMCVIILFLYRPMLFLFESMLFLRGSMCVYVIPTRIDVCLCYFYLSRCYSYADRCVFMLFLSESPLLLRGSMLFLSESVCAYVIPTRICVILYESPLLLLRFLSSSVLFC